MSTVNTNSRSVWYDVRTLHADAFSSLTYFPVAWTSATRIDVEGLHASHESRDRLTTVVITQ